MITFGTILLGPKLYYSRGLLPKTKSILGIRLDHVLSRRLKNQPTTKGEDAITINLLELSGMVMTAYVTRAILHDGPDTQGDPLLLRGHNVAAVSWINRCGGSHNRQPYLGVRLLGRLEITSGWSHHAKHIPGVQDVVTDGIWRWPKQKSRKSCRHAYKGNGESII